MTEVLQRVDGVGVLQVRIVGASPQQRRRLAQLLAAAPGIELTGVGPAGVEPVPARGALRPALSPRQRDVLVAYASGSDLLPVVARRLGIDEETLKTHLRRLRAKYRTAGRPAPTRRDLYVRAVEDGLVAPPSSWYRDRQRSPCCHSADSGLRVPLRPTQGHVAKNQEQCAFRGSSSEEK